MLSVIGVNLGVLSSLSSGTTPENDERGEEATTLVMFAFMRRCGGVASVMLSVMVLADMFNSTY